MVFLPIRTDAYLDRRPTGTVALILANVAAFLLARDGGPVDPDAWILVYGELNPLQWVSSLFMHAGWPHLIGNMVFLWCFGLAIEGVASPLRFIGFYLGVGALECGLEQMLMLGWESTSGDPTEIAGSLGASAAIFGLMAAAMVWAPRTRVTCLYFFLGPRIAKMSLLWLGAFYLFWEVSSALFGGFGLGSAVLHLAGAALGFPAAVLMLRLGLVDCGGWDTFSLRRRSAC